ncbi:hypothetical protein P153DRAFT_180961 [Dothidotthia symphoricarpi CBS 119687]|uniref:Uncharacterized protein n=1 Tax=Dothidotthia symphoricarpi CBS 119687 TaxID=1392245 RepID=A0A6A6AJC8_9PLEO|nr:uncharacterized protein P153DRAFT_180961 [Dothidotthia symphoricarpi CBS 119687]KAF2131910.1 hypothetical protein P153DRAFT_180961 [Dothidotthia symphoricarpi CBS 119687]
MATHARIGQLVREVGARPLTNNEIETLRQHFNSKLEASLKYAKRPGLKMITDCIHYGMIPEQIGHVLDEVVHHQRWELSKTGLAAMKEHFCMTIAEYLVTRDMCRTPNTKDMIQDRLKISKTKGYAKQHEELNALSALAKPLTPPSVHGRHTLPIRAAQQNSTTLPSEPLAPRQDTAHAEAASRYSSLTSQNSYTVKGQQICHRGTEMLTSRGSDLGLSRRDALRQAKWHQQIGYASVLVPHIRAYASDSVVRAIAVTLPATSFAASALVQSKNAGSLSPFFSSTFQAFRQQNLVSKIELPTVASGAQIIDGIQVPANESDPVGYKLDLMGKMELDHKKAAMVINLNKSRVLDLRREFVDAGLQGCSSSNRTAKQRELYKKFENKVAQSLGHDSTSLDIYTFKSRTHKAFEVLRRWKEKNYYFLIALAQPSLNTPMMKPMATDNTSKDIMSDWEDVVGPCMEELCAFPWRGLDAEQRHAAAQSLVRLANGVQVSAHAVNVNRTTWASQRAAFRHATVFPNISYVGGVRTATNISTSAMRIVGYAGMETHNFASMTVALDTGLVCPLDLQAGSFLGSVPGELHYEEPLQQGWVQGPNNVWFEPAASKMSLLWLELEPEARMGNVFLAWEVVEDEILEGFTGVSYRIIAFTARSVSAFTRLTAEWRN